MNKTLVDLLNYLKNPVLKEDTNYSLMYRLRTFVSLLCISIAFTFFISLVVGMLTSVGILDENKHAMDDYLKNPNTWQLLALAALIAPITEELIFRAPLVLFKRRKYFKIAFYGIGFFFALVHIFNFEINENVILFSPLLVAPQFFLGLIFGFIRIRFGLIWSIFLHSSYNGLLILLLLLSTSDHA